MHGEAVAREELLRKARAVDLESCYSSGLRLPSAVWIGHTRKWLAVICPPKKIDVIFSPSQGVNYDIIMPSCFEGTIESYEER